MKLQLWGKTQRMSKAKKPLLNLRQVFLGIVSVRGPCDGIRKPMHPVSRHPLSRPSGIFSSVDYQKPYPPETWSSGPSGVSLCAPVEL